MRTRHTQHTLEGFPIYSAAFITDDRLVLGGGGGSSHSGIKNKLRIYDIPKDYTLDLVDELELGKDEDAPMSMAVDIEGSRFVCGINSAPEQLKSGHNENCRLYTIEKNKIHLVATASTLTVSLDNLEECEKVTVLSPKLSVIIAAGARSLVLLSYPSLSLLSRPLTTVYEIYDATLSSKQIVIATTHHLLLYALPTLGPSFSASPGPETRSRTKQKKEKPFELEDLELLGTVDRPSLPGFGATETTYRAARFHPSDEQTLYTAINGIPPRSKSKGHAHKQGFICKWNYKDDSWKLGTVRRAGDKGITCFDVSPDGRFIAYGAADLSIGVLDAQTLAPLLTILNAHEFPATVIRFNPKATLLISGSADNSVRAVAIPDNLGQSNWTTLSIAVAILVLLLAILLSYAFQQGYLPRL